MDKGIVAEARTSVRSSTKDVWSALTNPDKIRQYMFGTNVESEWKEGSAITWKGEWEGRPYLDKGVIESFQPEKRLQYTHYSAMSGLPDQPENYHTVTIDLEPEGDTTRVTLHQDGNKDEKEKAHSEKNWSMMLEGLKKMLEG